jgi:hypothetical protein
MVPTIFMPPWCNYNVFIVYFLNLNIKGIEQLKKEKGKWEKKSKWKSLQAVFGRFSVGWLNPFTKPPLSARQEYAYMPV